MFGISTITDFGIVSLSGNSLRNNPEFIGSVINTLKFERANIKSMTTSCSGINLLMDLSLCNIIAAKLGKKISTRNANIKISDNIAVVAIVGDKDIKDTDWSESIMGALNSIGVPAHFCLLGVGSALSYIVIKKTIVIR